MRAVRPKADNIQHVGSGCYSLEDSANLGGTVVLASITIYRGP